MSILSPPERTGSKAKLRTIRMSAFKARAVLQLIQGKPFDEAVEILTFATEALPMKFSSVCIRLPLMPSTMKDLTPKSCL